MKQRLMEATAGTRHDLACGVLVSAVMQGLDAEEGTDAAGDQQDVSGSVRESAKGGVTACARTSSSAA